MQSAWELVLTIKRQRLVLPRTIREGYKILEVNNCDLSGIDIVKNLDDMGKELVRYNKHCGKRKTVKS